MWAAPGTRHSHGWTPVEHAAQQDTGEHMQHGLGPAQAEVLHVEVSYGACALQSRCTPGTCTRCVYFSCCPSQERCWAPTAMQISCMQGVLVQPQESVQDCSTDLDLHVDLAISKALDLDLAQLQPKVGSHLSRQHLSATTAPSRNAPQHPLRKETARLVSLCLPSGAQAQVSGAAYTGPVHNCNLQTSFFLNSAVQPS